MKKFELCGDATQNRDRVQSRRGETCESVRYGGFFIAPSRLLLSR